jgi:hypothetical protein
MKMTLNRLRVCAIARSFPGVPRTRPRTAPRGTSGGWRRQPGTQPGGLIGASWVECPAFEDDRGRGQISQEGDATDAEVRQPLGNVGTHERFTVVTIGDKQDRGHQRWIPPWIVAST